MIERREGPIGWPRAADHPKYKKKYPEPYEPAVPSSFKPYPNWKPRTEGNAKSNNRMGDVPGPGQYQVKLNTGGPSYQFGSRFDDKRVPAAGVKPDGTRFDSSLRAKPHLKPKKVDGPGPGDYALPDSVVTKKRDNNSMQMSTWGTGREQDASPNKLKKEFVMPGPAHYNHVYNDLRQYTKPHQTEGFTFSRQIRDIQK